jgi:hypothetical protein
MLSFFDMSNRLPGAWLLAGLGVYVLAEVVAYGSQLREDVEATI